MSGNLCIFNFKLNISDYKVSTLFIKIGRNIDCQNLKLDIVHTQKFYFVIIVLHSDSICEKILAYTYVYVGCTCIYNKLIFLFKQNIQKQDLNNNSSPVGLLHLKNLELTKSELDNTYLSTV